MITTHEEFAGDPCALRYGRGRQIPLFRSAASRVVQANLTPRRLRRVYDENATTEDVRHLEAVWRSNSKAMLEIRQQGYCLSRGELETRRIGLIAPIFDDKSRVLSSLSMIGNEERFASLDEAAMANLVREAVAEITRRIPAHQRSIAEPRGARTRTSARDA